MADVRRRQRPHAGGDRATRLAAAVPPAVDVPRPHLLEFPPVAGYGLRLRGELRRPDPRDRPGDRRGDVALLRRTAAAGRLRRSADGLVFATFIGDATSAARRRRAAGSWRSRRGRARSAGRGRSARASRRRSSPHGTVYFGDHGRSRLRLLAPRTGKERWSFDTGGAGQGAPRRSRTDASSSATTAASFYALDARTGKLIWQSGGHGNFYAGRLRRRRPRLRRLDRRPRLRLLRPERRAALELRDGRLRLRVAGRVARHRPRRLVRPHVLRDQRRDGIAALELRRGRQHLGAASVIDGIVYFSTLRPAQDVRPRAASGRLREKWNDGDYSPAVAAYGRLYLVGLGRIYALEPRAGHRAHRSR